MLLHVHRHGSIMSRRRVVQCIVMNTHCTVANYNAVDMTALSWNSMGPTPTRTSSPTSVRGSSRGCRRVRRLARSACFRTRTRIFADLYADLSDTCACTVHDKLSSTRLQNYTIGPSLMSVSVSVPWNSSFTASGVCPTY